MDSHKKLFLRRRLYLLLVALAWIIGSVICVGGVVHQVAQHLLINDEEYIASRHSYELQECEHGPYNAKIEDYSTRTPEEVALCKQEKTTSALLMRSMDFKDGLVEFASWGILFLALMLTHLPAFLRETKKD